MPPILAPSHQFCRCARRVSGLQLLIFAQRVGVYDGDLKLLYRAFDRAPKQKTGRLTYDQVRFTALWGLPRRSLLLPRACRT